MIEVAARHKAIENKLATTYRVASIAAPGSIAYTELKKPQPKKDEILVRLEGCGLCASNIPVWEGREWFDYPQEMGTPGHEGWGIIEAMGPDVARLETGQRVAVLDNHAFAEFVLLKENKAIPIPGAMASIPFPGEPFGCTMNIFKRADIQEGQAVAIIGMGFLGLSLVPLLKNAGARVIALSRRTTALEKALEAGADTVIPMDDHYQIIDKVKVLTDGNYCERVVECTGKQWPLDLAGELIGYYGKLVIAGYHQDGSRNVNMQLWNWKALDVINAHERDPEKYKEGVQEAIQAVVEGRVDPGELLTHAFSFEDLAHGLDTLKQGPEGFIKGYIKY